MPDDVPDNIRAFINGQIASILQLELLLQLAADPAKDWSADEAALALYVTPEAALEILSGMRSRGLLEASPPPDERFRFAPKNPDWGPLVSELKEFYKVRRLTVIDLIYSRPDDKLRDFADAFRVRKPK